MRVFVTGASGWIGSAAVTELLAAGHQVLGLARSDAATEAVTALGAHVHRGSLDDPTSLRDGAAACDGVVHLGYNHDFSRMDEAAQTDLRAIEAIGTTLVGTDRPFVVASGVLGLAPGRVATEQDMPEPGLHPRIAGIQLAMSFADRGVRSSSVRFAPTVHGAGDHGFTATLVAIARAKGISGYIADGSNRWPAVHRLDAGHLVRLAVENAPAGSALHAVAEEGVPTRAIAEAIGAGLDMPVVSVPADQAGEHFGWLARFFGTDARASNTFTRELLDWRPTHPGLLADLDEGHYFRTQGG
jgi:nucleoside-diphosphate-sugar epimerase